MTQICFKSMAALICGCWHYRRCGPIPYANIGHVAPTGHLPVRATGNQLDLYYLRQSAGDTDYIDVNDVTRRVGRAARSSTTTTSTRVKSSASPRIRVTSGVLTR